MTFVESAEEGSAVETEDDGCELGEVGLEEDVDVWDSVGV
jgi:hypothetical protein